MGSDRKDGQRGGEGRARGAEGAERDGAGRGGAGRGHVSNEVANP